MLIYVSASFQTTGKPEGIFYKLKNEKTIHNVSLGITLQKFQEQDFYFRSYAIVSRFI
jgi:hypothetical protein